MTSVIVNDASCLIDLRKGGLLAAICDLPYRLVVPLPIRVSEILDFSQRQWQHLDDAGLMDGKLSVKELELKVALGAALGLIAAGGPGDNIVREACNILGHPIW